MIECEHCGRYFERTGRRGPLPVFCSQLCSQRAWNERQRRKAMQEPPPYVPPNAELHQARCLAAGHVVTPANRVQWIYAVNELRCPRDGSRLWFEPLEGGLGTLPKVAVGAVR